MMGGGALYHEHPLRILRYSAKNIWLLVFPLLRGIHAFTLDVDKVYSWIKGAWFDILVLGAIMLFGYIRWYFSWITVTEESVIHTEGVFIRIKKAIPYKNISTVTVERSFYLRPFGGMRLYCNTSAGVYQSSDMIIMVTKRVCDEILKNVPEVRTDTKPVYRQNTAMSSVLLFSVFFSSSFSGAVYLAALFFKGGDIVQDMISVPLSRITEETAKLSDKLIVKIPAAAIGIGLFFLITWFISFMLNLVRYSKFFIESDRNTIEVSCGTFTRRNFRINIKHINYTDLRQNLVMKLLRAVAVNINCAGYGAAEKSFPLLTPMKKEKNLGGASEIIGAGSGAKNDFRPRYTSFWQYIWLPTITAALVPTASHIIERFVPGYSEFSLFAVIMVEIPLVWTIAVRTVALLTSGITAYDNKIMIKYCKGIGFHTIVADRSRLVKINVTQTPFQRISKKTTIGFYFNGEGQHGHYVKAITLDDAEKIMTLLDYSLTNL